MEVFISENPNVWLLINRERNPPVCVETKTTINPCLRLVEPKHCPCSIEPEEHRNINFKKNKTQKQSV